MNILLFEEDGLKKRNVEKGGRESRAGEREEPRDCSL